MLVLLHSFGNSYFFKRIFVMKCFTGKMQWLSIYVFLLDFSHHFFHQVTCSASEFKLQGDYLLGGLFSLNTVSSAVPQTYPVALDCDK